MDQESEPKQTHDLGFVIDIDGTLVLSHQEIKGASEALNILSRNKIPYVFLTNNISHSEQTKADELNKLLNLDVPIRGEQVVLNITPLKRYMEWK